MSSNDVLLCSLQIGDYLLAGFKDSRLQILRIGSSAYSKPEYLEVQKFSTMEGVKTLCQLSPTVVFAGQNMGKLLILRHDASNLKEPFSKLDEYSLQVSHIRRILKIP